MKDKMYIFTDGSCINNGRKNAIAGYAVYIGEDDPRNVSGRVEGKQSNNTGELTAMIKALEIAINEDKEKTINIYTDSNYVILCLTSYGSKLEAKKWTSKKPVPNIELVKYAYELFKKSPNIKLYKVEAHTGKQDFISKGNEMADKMANEAIGVFKKEEDDKIIILNVPYAKKDIAKELGAKYNGQKKKWYYIDNENISQLNKDTLNFLFT